MVNFLEKNSKILFVRFASPFFCHQSGKNSPPKETLLSMVQFAGCPQGFTGNIDFKVTLPSHCTNCESSLW
jgi:hypothetical protein